MKKTPVLNPGHVLDGRYELLRTWSAGGMGTVWLARVRGFQRFEKFFAVKMPLPEFADDLLFRSMFIDEARIIAQIRHGNVVGVEHLGEHAGIPYLALEWIQGVAWGALIRACHHAKTVPGDVMLRIAAGACAGLHAAHELRSETGEFLNVVHRDVSPHNVLVAETGTTKVIDFGIAKARGRMAEKTRTGTIKAKLEFAAPEQLLGTTIDRRADVWGMGVTLHFIFVGRMPFESDNTAQLIMSIEQGLTQPLPPHVPGPVAEVIWKALRPDPKDRFESIHEMKIALERCISMPTSPETVSACMQEFLSGPLAKRRQEIRLAVEESNRRSETDRAEVGSDMSNLSTPPRVMMPTLPPELTQREWDSKPSLVGIEQAPPSVAPPPPTKPRMGVLAWAMVLFSTLLAVAIWSRVALVALELRQGGGRPPAEQRQW